MTAFKDITGQRFCRLTVISRAENTANGKAMWNCVCDCGKTVTVWGSNLRNGHTRSCGCMKSEAITAISTIHGQTGTRMHAVWKCMKHRCNNPNDPGYHNYGGRGIRVCQEWDKDFAAFYGYVSKLPHFGETGYSIDRINNDGNYEPGNVKWSTAKEQANNRRKRCDSRG